MTTKMKIVLSCIIAIFVALGLFACNKSAPVEDASDVVQAQDGKHVIGMTVYSTSDSQVIMFNEYLQDYIAGQCFDDVQFVLSDNLSTLDDRLAFIDSLGEMGAEGVMGFYCQDLEAEVNECAKYGMYYLVPSGTVSDEDLAKVEDNEYFLGVFGPGIEMEYDAGYDMANFFADEGQGDTYIILSGGAPNGNEMHIQRVKGMLDALEEQYGVQFENEDDLVSSETAVSVQAGDVSVTICPGYAQDDESVSQISDAFAQADYDYCMSTVPVSSIVKEIDTKTTKMGTVDCYSQDNELLFNQGKLEYLTGKYGSSVGPAFAALYNAVNGHADQFRDQGKAFKITQGFWTSTSRADFEEKYELASSLTVNAYNYEDLQSVIVDYNPDASLDDLVALAGAYSFDDVKARRGL